MHTVVANRYDSKGLEKLINKLPSKYTCDVVYANKGYKVPSNNDLLKKRSIKNRIMHRAYHNRALSPCQVKFNSLISKSHWVVERTFGSVKKWFGRSTPRYMGLDKTHTQHVLQAICYNLKRSSGIIVSNSIKYGKKLSRGCSNVYETRKNDLK